jgi:hypothetical protein
MIAFTRRTARSFAAAAARCVSGRPRGPAPHVVLRRAGGRVSLSAAFPELALELAFPTPTPSGSDGVLVVPLALLREAGTASDDLVMVREEGRGRGAASWPAGDGFRSTPVEFVVPGKQHQPLPLPLEWRLAPARLLTALHECGRSAGRLDGRYALSRVQIRGGAAGRVVGTDGCVAVIYAGFAFPFAEDLLVPAVPLFGSPELRGASEVEVGRTETHLVVRAGPWTAWLSVAGKARYPDVASVVPKHSPTVVGVDDRDAAALLAHLPGMPGAAEEHRPVTLEADGMSRVRAGDPTIPRCVKELTLSRSPVAGPAVRVAADRRVLGRALLLGCRTLRLAADKPLLAEGEGVTLIAAPLNESLAVAAVDDAVRVATDPVDSREPERRTPMKPHEANGKAPDPRATPHTPSAPQPVDALAEAEGLRVLLAEAASRAARLVAVLKAGRKRERALEGVWASLDQLRPGGGS